MFLGLSVVCSCSKEEVPNSDPQPDVNTGDLPMGDAYITDSAYLTANRLKVYNFVYPSVDPYGEPVMLSGSITMGDDVSRDAAANGLVLYNHFTVYRADQCPSRGELSIQLDKSGIKVAQYMTELSSKEMLQRQLHKSLEAARQRWENCQED